MPDWNIMSNIRQGAADGYQENCKVKGEGVRSMFSANDCTVSV